MASNEKEAVEEESQAAAGDESGTASMSSWLSGWYDTAKQKLAETNEFMRHDIQEFTQAVQSDASKLVAVTATTMKEKLNINVDLEEASAATRVVKDSLSNFLGNIASKVGPIRPDSEGEKGETAYVGTSSGTKVLSPAEARVFAIRTDPATFCNEPDNESDFSAWLPEFDLEGRKNEISSLMLDCTQIRSLYTKLVPAAVSHRDFWARYFFKIHQHEKDEERRAMLVERAHKTHDDIEWEDDEDEWVQTDTPPERMENNVSSQPETIPATDLEETRKDDTESSNDKKITEFSHQMENKTDGLLTSDIEVIQPMTSDIEVVQPKVEKLTELSTETSKPENTEGVLVSGAALECPRQDATCLKEDLDEEPSVNKPAELSKPAETKSTTDSTETKSEQSADAAAQETQNKIPSSEGSSDDWEKDFDLDMTEDEIQQALQESDKIDVEGIAEDWEDWE